MDEFSLDILGAIMVLLYIATLLSLFRATTKKAQEVCSAIMLVIIVALFACSAVFSSGSLLMIALCCMPIYITITGNL